ncbi:MAG: hypothetical protein ACYDEJ_12040 [Desulfitobacteriaceae bacterium]
MSIVWNPVNWTSKKFIILMCVFMLSLLMTDWSKFDDKPLYSGSYSQGITPEINSSPFLLEYTNGAIEAEVKIIIWFNNQYSIEWLKEALPLKKWHWEESVRYTAGGQKAISLVGQTKIDRLGERELKKWYFDLVGKINSSGGQVYLDERIHDNIDIVAFLSQVGAEPKQWMLDGSTLSVAAIKPGLGKGIYAGKDQVNLQLLTRFSKGGQKSVLALPTLIEEF